MSDAEKRSPTIAEALLKAYSACPENERRNLRAFLNSALSGRMPDCRLPSLESVDAITVQGLIQFFEATAASGLIARGVLAGELLRELSDEARHLHGKRSVSGRSWAVDGGPAARMVANDEKLHEALQSQLHTQIGPTGYNSYLYYEGSGSGLNPHVDRDEYEINVLVLLEHVSTRTPESSLRFWQTTGEQIVDFSPGSWLAFHAGGTVHGRTNCGDGEAVTLVSLGFAAV